jgi:phospholipid/cholesterol/gamma-HCH transport system permease protein
VTARRDRDVRGQVVGDGDQDTTAVREVPGVPGVPDVRVPDGRTLPGLGSAGPNGPAGAGVYSPAGGVDELAPGQLMVQPAGSLTGEERPGERAPPGAGGASGAANAVGAVAAGVREAGAPVVGFLNAVGDHVLLIGRALAWLPRRPFRWANYLDAAEYIGFGSLPIVLLVGAFTGLVTSLQSVVAFSQFGLESFSGGATGKALSIELGPVLTSLMLSGRVGAGIATELGTMRITEQIDALESMAVSPVQYLVLPRLIAAMIVTPILAMVFFVVGMGSAWFYAVIVAHVDQGQWIQNLRDLVSPSDVVQGLIKSVFFGFLVALVGCYQGMNASGGGRGVGIGTTRAVVVASVSTLIIDFFLTDILFALFGTGKG